MSIDTDNLERLEQQVRDADADRDQDLIDAEVTGERPDLHEHEMTVAVDDVRAVLAELIRLRGEVERLAKLNGKGCDGNGGGDHSVISQGTYSFCANCGETVRVKNCRARVALAERKGTDQ